EDLIHGRRRVAVVEVDERSLVPLRVAAPGQFPLEDVAGLEPDAELPDLPPVVLDEDEIMKRPGAPRADLRRRGASRSGNEKQQAGRALPPPRPPRPPRPPGPGPPPPGDCSRRRDLGTPFLADGGPQERAYPGKERGQEWDIAGSGFWVSSGDSPFPGAWATSWGMEASRCWPGRPGRSRSRTSIGSWRVSPTGRSPSSRRPPTPSRATVARRPPSAASPVA